MSDSPPRASLPSTSRQKSFIVENSGILNLAAKRSILSIVMMEIGPSVVLESGGAQETNIDLDAVGDTNEEVLAHIYNIAWARLQAMNQPARAGDSDQGARR